MTVAFGPDEPPPWMVTVCAVVPAPEHVRGIRDSKELTRPEREKASRAVRRWARGIGVGHATYVECDELGMTEALRIAAMRALAELDAQGFVPDRIVLDGNFDYLRMPSKVTTVIKGDAKCLAVAAASCVAKVTRDHMMIEEAEHYPPYDFESNVGYPAPAHKLALAGYGPSAIHRRSWIFIESLCWRGVPPGAIVSDIAGFSAAAAGAFFAASRCARSASRCALRS